MLIQCLLRQERVGFPVPKVPGLPTSKFGPPIPGAESVPID
jgi:hypothetical protein